MKIVDPPLVSIMPFLFYHNETEIQENSNKLVIAKMSQSNKNKLRTFSINKKETSFER